MFFVTKYHDVEALRKRLVKISTERKYEVATYEDPANGEKWIECLQDPDARAFYILRRLNLPGLAELVSKCLSSPREDDGHGLALYFAEEGVDSDQLLTALKNSRDRFSPTALKAFAEHLELWHLIDVVGMTIDQVEVAFKHFTANKSEIYDLIGKTQPPITAR